MVEKTPGEHDNSKIASLTAGRIQFFAYPDKLPIIELGGPTSAKFTDSAFRYQSESVRRHRFRGRKAPAQGGWNSILNQVAKALADRTWGAERPHLAAEATAVMASVE